MATTDAPWGVRDLVVRYGSRAALEGVALAIRPGTITAVVGGDGAGKTTLLRTLAGTVRPSAGAVRRPPDRAIGSMPAAGGVYPDLTADENLAFAGGAYGLRRAELLSRSGALLERTGLAGVRGRLAANLSGGMRQKLALAMAMLHEPALLILDEPTTGIDPVSRAELWRLIGGAAAAGAAIVFATVYLDEAERAGFVLALDAGLPLVAGTPEEIVNATPGVVVEAAERPPRETAWRRAGRWRWWSPDGRIPPGAAAAAADLEDAVIVAALARGAARGPA